MLPPQHLNWPAAEQNCGPVTAAPVTVQSPLCDKEVVVPDCGYSASTAQTQDTLPSNLGQAG